MKKRIVSLLLAAVLVVGFVPLGMIAASANEETKEVTAKGSIFTGTGDPVDLTAAFDFDWLTAGDNTVYNGKLAAFSAIASQDAYFREKDAGTASENRVAIRGQEAAYDCAAFLTAFGFEDVRRIETYDKTSTDIDKNDSATFLAGHHTVDGRDVFVFVFRGAYSSGEWLSVFDVGDPASFDKHPCWTNKDNLKSIDVAANAAMAKISDYVKEFGKADAPDSILLTGHSRGGAIANVLGAEFEDQPGVRSYTYTFSSPKITTSPDAARYQTVFNVVNADDFYEDFLAFPSESLVRYGVDLKTSFGENAELLKQLKDLEPAGAYASMPAADRERYRQLFAGNFKSREEIYKTTTETLVFETAAEAQKKFDDCNTVISGFKLDDLCHAELDGNKVILTTAKASLLKSYSMVLAYGTPDMVDYVKTLFPDDEIAELLYGDLGGMTNAHQVLKAYVMSLAADPGENPDTGDRSPLTLWVVVAALCLTGVAAGYAIGKKMKK